MRFQTYPFIAVLLMLSLIFSQCQQKKKEVKPEVYEALPAFDIDSAFHFLKKQTDFGPRVPNTDAHDSCAHYLHTILTQFCDSTARQSFTVKAYNGTLLKGENIIGIFNPECERRVVLCSHWDSRHVADHDPIEANRNTPIDGANDGASGVAVLLEIARQLQIKAPQIGIDIVFFDVEDYGAPEWENAPEGEWWGLGSQYWAKHPHKDNYKAEYGILLDMVGAADAQFRYEYFSAKYAQDILTKVWTAAYKIGHKHYFVPQKSHPITDDHYYVNTLSSIRMIDIIHQDDTYGTGFYHTWHTLSDNIENIDKKTLGVVGTTLLYVIYNEK